MLMRKGELVISLLVMMVALVVVSQQVLFILMGGDLFLAMVLICLNSLVFWFWIGMFQDALEKEV